MALYVHSDLTEFIVPDDNCHNEGDRGYWGPSFPDSLRSADGSGEVRAPQGYTEFDHTQPLPSLPEKLSKKRKSLPDLQRNNPSSKRQNVLQQEQPIQQIIHPPPMYHPHMMLSTISYPSWHTSQGYIVTPQNLMSNPIMAGQWPGVVSPGHYDYNSYMSGGCYISEPVQNTTSFVPSNGQEPMLLNTRLNPSQDAFAAGCFPGQPNMSQTVMMQVPEAETAQCYVNAQV